VEWVIIIIVYLIILNLLGFIIMGVDKGKAKQGAWRIPEKTLLLTAIAGGSIGMLLGMNAFRHKTGKRKFSFGVPFIVCLQVLAAFYVYLF